MPVTKEDLQKQIEELEAQVRELTSQVVARDAVLSESGTDGWLVTTPNSGYTGITAAVKFDNGRAFLPVTDKDAEKKINILVGDFGYSARKMTARDFQSLVKAAPPKEKSAAEKIAEAIAPPQFVT
jgi:cell division septum initiation protein DivIVA